MLMITLIPKGLPIAGLVYILEDRKSTGITGPENSESKLIKGE